MVVSNLNRKVLTNYNAGQNTSLKLIVLFVAYGCVFWQCVYAGDKEPRSVMTMNLNAMEEKADLILIGNPEIITQPDALIGKKRFYENGIRGETFYRIKGIEVLKGSLPAKSFLIVRKNVLSSEGRPPEIEALPYLLFLQKVDLDKDTNFQNLAFYRLVDNWKGIIPIDETAVEQRSVDRIAKQYGINVHKRLEDFKEAIRYSLKEQKTKAPKKDIAPGAFAIYEELKLNEAVSTNRSLSQPIMETK